MENNEINNSLQWFFGSRSNKDEIRNRKPMLVNWICTFINTLFPLPL